MSKHVIRERLRDITQYMVLVIIIVVIVQLLPLWVISIIGVVCVILYVLEGDEKAKTESAVFDVKYREDPEKPADEG